MSTNHATGWRPRPPTINMLMYVAQEDGSLVHVLVYKWGHKARRLKELNIRPFGIIGDDVMCYMLEHAHPTAAIMFSQTSKYVQQILRSHRPTLDLFDLGETDYGVKIQLAKCGLWTVESLWLSSELPGPRIKDLSPLSGLASLMTLVLSDTDITDLSPLSGLTSLMYLYLSRTYFTDLSPLSGLTSLRIMNTSPPSPSPEDM